MSNSNFNFVAPWYDFLGQLVFGTTLKQSQIAFLNELEEGNTVLVLGGGTGWVLEELNALKIPLRITYIEPSEKMMQRSKNRRRLDYLTVDFVTATFQEATLSKPIDAVCTFYFLDLFQAHEIDAIIAKINGSLGKKAKWFFADFSITEKSSWVQKLLVKFMFLFFRTLANLQSNELLNFKKHITETGFSEVKSKSWRQGLIQSSLFEKM